MACHVDKLCLVTLMGLPGSGKTTTALKIKEGFQDTPETLCIVLHYDEFIPLHVQATFGEHKNLAKALRKNFITCVHYLACKLLGTDFDLALALSSEPISVIDTDSLIQKIEKVAEDALKIGEIKENGVIVIDDNNYYTSMRNDFYQISKSLRCSFCVLYCKISVNDAMERNSKRPTDCQVSDIVISDMSKKIEEPDPMGSTCDVFCIQLESLNPESDHMSSITTLLSHSLSNPVIPPPDRSLDKRICSESEIHQADLVMRKWINSQLKIASLIKKGSQSRKAFSEELNSQKSKVLRKLKSGEHKITALVHQELEFREEIISLVKGVNLENDND